MRRRQKQTYTLREMEGGQRESHTDKEKLRHTDRQAEKDFYIHTPRETRKEKLK